MRGSASSEMVTHGLTRLEIPFSQGAVKKTKIEEFSNPTKIQVYKP